MRSGKRIMVRRNMIIDIVLLGRHGHQLQAGRTMKEVLATRRVEPDGRRTRGKG